MLIRRIPQDKASWGIGPMLRLGQESPVGPSGCLLQALNLFYAGGANMGQYHPAFHGHPATAVAHLNDVILRLEWTFPTNPCAPSRIKTYLERLAAVSILPNKIVRELFSDFPLSWYERPGADTLSPATIRENMKVYNAEFLPHFDAFLDRCDAYILKHVSCDELRRKNIEWVAAPGEEKCTTTATTTNETEELMLVG